MGYITDRDHLAKVIQAGLGALLELQDAWLEEDRAACAPRSGPAVAVSGGGTSAPTETAATGPDHLDPRDPGVPRVDMAKYRHRDRLGSRILTAVQRLEDMVRERKPRQAGGPCSCCELETATHGRDSQGRPTDCWACWTFLRRMGRRCTDDIHEGRGRVRMCECPPECCDVCPDRAAEQRSMSERCRKRMQRARAS